MFLSGLLKRLLAYSRSELPNEVYFRRSLYLRATAYRTAMDEKPAVIWKGTAVANSDFIW
jgi:hypothetical protein